MNSVQLIGNLARDPEIRFTKTGRAVAMFTVAVSRSYTPAGSQEPRELTDFIPCVAWGNLAELVGNNLAKGNHVFVEGRMSVRSYETAEGQKRYVTEVVANFVGNPLGSDKRQAPADGFTPAPAAAPKPAAGGSFDHLGKDVSDEEIPF